LEKSPLRSGASTSAISSSAHVISSRIGVGGIGDI
jgi:hypothetical protein